MGKWHFCQAEVWFRQYNTSVGQAEGSASVRALPFARRMAHNRRYLNLLQQLSALLPAPLWLIALESNTHNLTLRGLSHRYEAITQFEQQLTALPLLRRGQLAEVAQRQDGLFSFALVAQWGRDE